MSVFVASATYVYNVYKPGPSNLHLVEKFVTLAQTYIFVLFIEITVL